jgi:hypothetical protein
VRAFLGRFWTTCSWALVALRRRTILTSAIATHEALAPEQILVGTLSEEELAFLEELIRATNDLSGPIVEIGTLFGLATVQLAVWKAPGRRIITVDDYSWNPWGLNRRAHALLTSRVLHALTRSGEVTPLVMEKKDFYRSFKGERPSLVFLDAVHTYEETMADIAWAKRIGAQTVSGHDYSDEFPGVKQAVDESGRLARLVGSLWVLA